jgi:hypothetical protein
MKALSMSKDQYSENIIHELLKNKKNTVFLSFLSILFLYLFFSYCISLFAFISPSGDLRWDGEVSTITSTQYHRGQTVAITGFLEEATQYKETGVYFTFTYPENVVYSITVMDPDDLPIYHKTESLSSIQGDITLDPISFTLASDALYGTYKVRVLVWTDWLPNGDTRTYQIQEQTFEVIP